MRALPPARRLAAHGRIPMPSIDLADLRARVDAAVEAQLARGAADLEPLQPEAGDLLEVIGRLMSGGKRLRPIFLYVGYRAGGRPDCAEAVALAASMEFIQGAVDGANLFLVLRRATAFGSASPGRSSPATSAWAGRIRRMTSAASPGKPSTWRGVASISCAPN